MSEDPNEARPGETGFGRMRMVLVGTQHPGNIGSAARAEDDGPVAAGAGRAERFPHAEADALAPAPGMLASARVLADPAGAVSDCRLVLGCTARDRRIALPMLSLREAAAQVAQVARGDGEVALLFGRERTGLDNAELQLCHAAVHSRQPDYGSLNLAAAVQGAGLRSAPGAACGRAGRGAGEAHEPPATHAQLEGLFAQLAETLDAIDFH